MSASGQIYIANIVGFQHEGELSEKVQQLIRVEGIARARLCFSPIDPADPSEGQCLLQLLAMATTREAADEVIAALEAQGGAITDELTWPNALDELPRRVAERPNGCIVAFEDFDSGNFDPLELLPKVAPCAQPA